MERERILREFYRRPARNDIVVSEVAPGLQDIGDIRMADFDSDWATSQRPSILENAQSVIMGR